MKASNSVGESIQMTLMELIDEQREDLYSDKLCLWDPPDYVETPYDFIEAWWDYCSGDDPVGYEEFLDALDSEPRTYDPDTFPETFGWEDKE